MQRITKIRKDEKVARGTDIYYATPYVRIQNLVNNRNIGRDTASKYLKILCDIGFLEEVKRGREKLFINHKFLALLKKE